MHEQGGKRDHLSDTQAEISIHLYSIEYFCVLSYNLNSATIILSLIFNTFLPTDDLSCLRNRRRLAALGHRELWDSGNNFNICVFLEGWF